MLQSILSTGAADCEGCWLLSHSCCFWRHSWRCVLNSMLRYCVHQLLGEEVFWSGMQWLAGRWTRREFTYLPAGILSIGGSSELKQICFVTSQQ